MLRTICLLIISAFFSTSPLHAAPLSWYEVAPGLTYTKIPIGAKESPGWLHAFRVDLARYRVDCLLAKDAGTKTAMVREMAARAQAVLAINGGFFSPEFEPLGLRIQSGKIRNPLKNTSWWSIFYVHNGIPYFTGPQGYAPREGTSTAVQSGPRLTVNSLIPPLKGGMAERSAVGVTRWPNSSANQPTKADSIVPMR